MPTGRRAASVSRCDPAMNFATSIGEPLQQPERDRCGRQVLIANVVGQHKLDGTCRDTQFVWAGDSWCASARIERPSQFDRGGRRSDRIVQTDIRQRARATGALSLRTYT